MSRRWRLTCPAWLALVACGPLSSTYEVELSLIESCVVRGVDEACQVPENQHLTQLLHVEPRADKVFIYLDRDLFVADHDGYGQTLHAERLVKHLDLDRGCEVGRTQRITVTPDLWQAVGTYTDLRLTTGGVESCGTTPSGQRQAYEISGTKVDP